MSVLLLDESVRSQMAQRSEGLDIDADMDASSIPGRSAWKGKVKALATLTAVLDQLESVDLDTKRESLERLLEILARDARSSLSHICVLCSSKATASYLQTAISDRGTKTWLLTSGNAPEDLSRELDGFKDEGGVLISTVAMLQGLDLRYVQAIIHYDPPASEAELHVRAARSPAATNYILVDNSGVLPDEWNSVSPPNAVQGNRT